MAVVAVGATTLRTASLSTQRRGRDREGARCIGVLRDGVRPAQRSIAEEDGALLDIARRQTAAANVVVAVARVLR